MQASLDPRLLQTFVRAAQTGSLSTAALQVGRTQSAVTMQMQRLEEALGQTLMHRSGSGVRLTSAGEKFLTYAERILKAHDEALAAFSDHGLKGSIVFGCPEDYLLAFFPKIFRSFGTNHGNVDIKVVAAPTVELRGLLHSGQVDLALISTLNPSDAKDIIRTEAMVWVGAKATLEEHEFGDRIPLALPASNAMDHRAACDAMTKAGLQYSISYASNSIAGLIAVTRSGLAISVMTKNAVPPDLHIVHEPMPTLPLLGMKLALPSSEVSAATQAFMHHITTSFGGGR
ncbi:LysR family transcriptional regulator [Brucella haematophila]|uniref:LysR family transcriptional regulator n=1 Tax=Brucella haematophila TaxID=419474 RepID=A0ABX1DUG7_9HYPH|nr:LysR family transcriptional regulator [Brucella haematophila]NKC05223.1 LysR family transcriptional regulator [Brucella haematophila]TMV02486.1 LysR family transcriptional regulator [Brucella haematophila]